jgi:hypothetical protein
VRPILLLLLLLLLRLLLLALLSDRFDAAQVLGAPCVVVVAAALIAFARSVVPGSAPCVVCAVM